VQVLYSLVGQGITLFDRLSLSFLTLGVILTFYGSSYAVNYQCGYEPEGCDQNPDCSSVMQQCTGPYNGQYLCPINQTTCNPSYVCPNGGTYNSSVGKCQVDPTISCPSGGSYNSSTNRCEAS
jgi:hypothetical protein